MKGDDWTMTHAAATWNLPPSFRAACSGTFRVTENDGKRPAMLECDGCGAVLTVRQSVLTGAPPAQPTEAMPF